MHHVKDYTGLIKAASSSISPQKKGGGVKPYCSSRLLYSVGVTPHTFLNARTKLL